MNFNVLIVEDDPVLRSTLSEALQVDGYRVQQASTLEEARARLNDQVGDKIDLVLLDLGLPDGNGTELLRELRQKSGLPLLVISAQGSEHTKVGLFDDGADDYLVKPFGLDELLARMRATLRHRSIKQQPGQNIVRIGDLAIDMLNWKVERAGKTVHLTPTEFNLLSRLVRSAGQVVTHKQLLVDVWGEAYADHTHYLRMYMAQLRAKLETDPSRPKMLQTETGVGYRLQDTG